MKNFIFFALFCFIQNLGYSQTKAVSSKSNTFELEENSIHYPYTSLSSNSNISIISIDNKTFADKTNIVIQICANSWNVINPEKKIGQLQYIIAPPKDKKAFYCEDEYTGKIYSLLSTDKTGEIRLDRGECLLLNLSFEKIPTSTQFFNLMSGKEQSYKSYQLIILESMPDDINLFGVSMYNGRNTKYKPFNLLLNFDSCYQKQYVSNKLIFTQKSGALYSVSYKPNLSSKDIKNFVFSEENIEIRSKFFFEFSSSTYNSRDNYKEVDFNRWTPDPNFNLVNTNEDRQILYILYPLKKFKYHYFTTNQDLYDFVMTYYLKDNSFKYDKEREASSLRHAKYAVHKFIENTLYQGGANYQFWLTLKKFFYSVNPEAIDAYFANIDYFDRYPYGKHRYFVAKKYLNQSVTNGSLCKLYFKYPELLSDIESKALILMQNNEFEAEPYLDLIPNGKHKAFAEKRKIDAEATRKKWAAEEAVAREKRRQEREALERWMTENHYDDSENDSDENVGNSDGSPETEIDFELIEHTGIDYKDAWEESPYSSAQRQYIKFNDGVGGYIFNDKDGYHITPGAIDDFYYKSENDAIRALFVLKKYGIVIKRNRK